MLCLLQFDGRELDLAAFYFWEAIRYFTDNDNKLIILHWTGLNRAFVSMKGLSLKHPPPQYSFPSLQMPPYIGDQIVLPPYLKVKLLSAILAAIAYGIVVVLSGNCFHLLLKKRDIYPNRMRILLLIYVIVMLLSSTWGLIGSTYKVMEVFTPLHTSDFLYRSFKLPLTVTMWGADGFMVRILIICQEQRFTMQL